MSADEKDDATEPIVDRTAAEPSNDEQATTKPILGERAAAEPAAEPAATEPTPGESVPGEPAPGEPAASAPATPAAPTTPAAPAAAWASAYRTDAYTAERAPRPSIRWGGVVWGAILVVFAATMLWVVSARSRVLAAEVWLRTLSPSSAWTLALVAAGTIILILALLAVVRSAQRRRRA